MTAPGWKSAASEPVWKSAAKDHHADNATEWAELTDKKLRRKARRIGLLSDVLTLGIFASIVAGLWVDWRYLVMAPLCWLVAYCCLSYRYTCRIEADRRGIALTKRGDQ